MGKYIATVACGIGAGIAALGIANQESVLDIRDGIRNNGIDIITGPVSSEVQHLSAFAVGRITGVVTVHGDYDLVRWGPAPNCNINMTMELPFLAEPIIRIGDLAISTEVNANGLLDVTATLQGEVEALNPRSVLTDAIISHDGNGWGQMCSEGNYEKLFDNMWDIGAEATNTAVDCLTGSIHIQYYTDANGTQVQTEASAELHQLYKDDLALSLRAIYPTAENIDVIFPDLPSDYNPNATDAVRELQNVIAEANNDDKYVFDTEAVDSCIFESVSIDLGVPRE